MAPARNSASNAGPNVPNGGMATHLVPFLDFWLISAQNRVAVWSPHSGCAGGGAGVSGRAGGRANSNPTGLTQDCYPALRGTTVNCPHGHTAAPKGE